jgi:hypothetical protein
VTRPVAGPLVGYRCWMGEDLEGCDRPGAPAQPVLRSVSFHATDWASGTVTAACNTWSGAWSAVTHGPLLFRKQAPQPGCSCGLYAYDSLETAKVHFRGYLPQRRRQMVLGAVLLWGRVVVSGVAHAGERGGARPLLYRAEHGSALLLRSEDPVAGQVAERYRIPLVSERYLAAKASELGAHLAWKEVGSRNSRCWGART